ncbi:MAG: 50S ribosomal protein L11 methyltransferase [Candidatus Peribacteraceae bacterium]|nr:50S ribosomal protein L11 methyltransferase [Candidatus Peribacteraceae bacterium]
MFDLLAFLGIVLLLTIFYFFVAGFFRSPFVPSNRKTIAKMLEIAKIKAGDRVIDLGCGDGRIVFRAEKQFRAKAEGYEISIFVWIFAQINRLFRGAKSKIYRKNLFDVDLSEADVVFCYLLPAVMQKLSPKFKKELKRGARIISASFSLHDWKAKKVYPAEARAAKIFVYEQS